MLVGQRSQAIEERQQPDGEDEGHDDLERNEHAGSGQPPERRRRHQGVDDLDREEAERAADQSGFQPIGEPGAEGLVNETVALREPISAEPRQGKRHEGLADRDGRGHGGDAPRQRAREIVGPSRDGGPETDEQDDDEVHDRHGQAQHAEDELEAMVPLRVVGHAC